MFDEQPDGDPHGECAAEIYRLMADLAAAQRELAAYREPTLEDARGLGFAIAGRDTELGYEDDLLHCLKQLGFVRKVRP